MKSALLITLCLAFTCQADSRKVFDAASPLWMEAIGRLSVPSQTFVDNYANHHTEHCTATLVSNKASGDARYILSAWHCLEDYRDLSMDIEFTLPALGLSRHARLVESGGGMAADWAILKLNRPVSTHEVQALRIRPPPGAGSALEVTMAGYSSDDLLGQGGKALTYDEDCHILAAGIDLVTTSCNAFKGASGGPVVGREGSEYHLLGVISVGDSGSRSMYVPTALFASALRLHL